MAGVGQRRGRLGEVGGVAPRGVEILNGEKDLDLLLAVVYLAPIKGDDADGRGEEELARVVQPLELARVALGHAVVAVDVAARDVLVLLRCVVGEEGGGAGQRRAVLVEAGVDDGRNAPGPVGAELLGVRLTVARSSRGEL